MNCKSTKYVKYFSFIFKKKTWDKILSERKINYVFFGVYVNIMFHTSQSSRPGR